MASFDPTVDSRHGFPIVLAEASGVRIVVDDRFAELVGRPKDELLGQTWQSIAHPLDLQKRATMIQRTLAGGPPLEAPWRQLRGDGTWLRGILYSSRVVEPGTGRVLLQANFRPDPISEALLREHPGRPDLNCIEFIATMARELQKMAGEQKLTLLQHFLAMASEEAGQELERRLAAQSGQNLKESLSLH